ncbi:MAG TPA: SgcJ/EcaC family oxidoreductase [Candidatus Lumbricidophila sp.]|nr:SgcJ/EcaC family oxidoreductase [Candidatus Lumbricidophila sp.]
MKSFAHITRSRTSATALVGVIALAGLGLTACAPTTTKTSAASTPSPSPTAAALPTQAEISARFDTWNAALQTGDASKVAALYANDAVLLPTVSNQVRTDQAGITDYFTHFLENKPSGKRTQSLINVLDENSAIDTGIYDFTLTDPKTNAKSVVTARYTFEYEKRDGKWLIVNHHSSKLPEG